MKKQHKICAVIVTFNRKKLLVECLNALKNQTYPLDAVFIIDGPSTDGTERVLKENGFIRETPPSFTEYKNKTWYTRNIIIQDGKPTVVHYTRIYDDVGGSGGFYEGFKKAYCEGYDWIWVMDDDVRPSSTALEALIKALLKSGYDAARPSLIGVKDFSPWFAGGLFSKEVIKKAGLPLKEFFIYCDDVEYMNRCYRAGVRVLDVRDAKVYHKDWLNKGMKYKTVLGKVIARPIFPRGRKYYYIQRNEIYVLLRYRKLKALVYALSFRLIYNLIAYLILGDTDKVLSILKGTLDAFFRKTGKCEWAHQY